MSKRTFIAFGIVVVVLAVGIPWLVFNDKGGADAGPQNVASSLKNGQELFKVNCGNCHALSSAGADGNYGPDLDELLGPAGPPEGPTAESTIKSTEGRVLNAIENGVDGATTAGRMPAEIVNEEQAKEISEFVARTAGRG